MARMMRMSEYYFPIFEEKLNLYGLPYELKYLPIIESALNPKAVLPVYGSSCLLRVNCTDWRLTRWWTNAWM